MGITVLWDNDEQTAIRYVLDGTWTWEDMRAAIATSNAMLEQANRKIDFLYDMTHSDGIPNGILSHLRSLVGREQPNTGRQLIVGAKKSVTTAMARRLLSIVEKVYGANWQIAFADTLDEARALLAKPDAQPEGGLRDQE
jgi:hypothetical protein